MSYWDPVLRLGFEGVGMVNPTSKPVAPVAQVEGYWVTSYLYESYTFSIFGILVL